MLAWVRTVLVWLLVLALPAQGAAAATMALCGPGHAARTLAHEHGKAMAQQAWQVLQHVHVQGQAASRDSHQHVHTSPQPSGDQTRDQVEPVAQAKLPNLAQAEQHKCSVCASCCSAAALFSVELIVPTPEFTPTIFMAVVATVEPFASAGPDRPPRRLLV